MLVKALAMVCATFGATARSFTDVFVRISHLCVFGLCASPKHLAMPVSAVIQAFTFRPLE